MLECVGRTSFSSHDREAEETEVGTLPALDELIDMLDEMDPVAIGRQDDLRAESEDILDEALHVHARVDINGHAFKQRCDDLDKHTRADKRRQMPIGDCSFAEGFSFLIEDQRIAAHSDHRLIAHADLVCHSLFRCAG